MNLRLALRSLVQHRTFSLLAILMLAVCIGPATAMFSIVDTVFLKPLPYPDADRLVEVSERLTDGSKSLIAALNFVEWERQNTVFDRIAARVSVRENMLDGKAFAVIWGSRTTASYFDVFHVAPELGRRFTSDEEIPGRNNVVVLSHGLWLRQFGGDAGVVGRAIRLGGESFTVIGVLGASDPLERDQAQYWRPLTLTADERTHGLHLIDVAARLKPGISIVQAQTQMSALAEHLAEQHPDSNKGVGVIVSSYLDNVMGLQFRRSVLLWSVAIASLFLIGLANLVNLTLARSSTRGREVAIRVALGAGTRRIASEFLTESLVLALTGGAAGFALASAIMGLFRSVISAGTLPREANLALDWRTLLFGIVVSCTSGIACGIIPVFRFTDAAFAHRMHSSNRSTMDSRRKQLLASSVVLQLALSLMLLACSGLLMQSFIRLMRFDLGYDTSRLLTMWLSIPATDKANPESVRAYLDRVEQQVGALPGVIDAAATSAQPALSWGYGMAMQIDGRETLRISERPVVGFKMISPSYFDAISLNLLAGRSFTKTDDASAPRVAVINGSLARQYFNGENPVGRRLRIPEVVPDGLGVGEDVTWEIVGVVSDERFTQRQPTAAGMYVPIRQSLPAYVSLVVRTNGPAAALEKPVQRAIDSVSTDQVVDRLMTGTESKDSTISTNRQQTVLLITFSTIATFLAACGIYGLISFVLSQRLAEIGIRMALGSTRGGIFTLFMRQVMLWTLAGVASGLALSFAAVRLLQTVLAGVTGSASVAFSIAIATLIAVAALSASRPLYRVSRTDPMTVLRGE